MKFRKVLSALLLVVSFIFVLSACDSNNNSSSSADNDNTQSSTINNTSDLSFTISYVLNGGLNNPKNPSSYISHTTSTILYPASTNEIASVFDGWYSSPGYESENKVTYIPADYTGNITLYAKWINYKIESADEFTFNYVDYEFPLISLTVPNSKSIIALSNSIKVSDGCTWTLSKDVEGLDVVPTKNISLKEGHNTAYVTVWYSEDYNLLYKLDVYRLGSFEYTFKSFDNILLHEENFEENSYVQEPKNIDMRKDYYNFKGWTVDGESIISFPYKITESTIFNAVYEPIEYNIEYNLDGGEYNNYYYPNPTKYSVVSNYSFKAPSKAGYTFDGWYYNNLKIVNTNNLLGKGDVTLTARWTKAIYYINCVLNGGEIDSTIPSQFSFDSEDIIIPNPTKLGYEFLGWSINNNQVLEKDYILKSGTIGNQTLVANWQLIDYSIKYVLDGGINNINNKSTYNKNNYSLSFDKPSKDGYEFIGWSSAIFDGNVINLQLVFGNGNIEYQDITLVANWKPIEYSITYKLAGGTNTGVNPSTYTIEDDVNIMFNPKKLGYTFNCWKNVDSDEIISDGFIEKGNYGNLNLEAVWDSYLLSVSNDSSKGTINVSGGSCNVWFNLNGGSWNSECYKKVTMDDGLSMPQEIPFKEGYIFEGWYNGNTKFSFSNSTKIDSDLILSAHWKSVSSKISSTPDEFYDLSNYKSMENALNVDITESNEKRSKLLFITCFKSGTIVIYKKNKFAGSNYVATLKMYYTTEGSSSVVSSSTYTINSTDWSTIQLNGSAGTTYIFELIPSSQYYETTLSFYITGNGTDLPTTQSKYSGIVNNSNVTAGETVILTATPKTGYEFDGWYRGDKLLSQKLDYTFIMPSNDIELLAKWIQSIYSIEYDLDGGINDINNPKTYKYRDTKTLYQAYREGYTFDGWFSNGTKIDNISSSTFGDLVLKAKWTPNAYTINYDLNGGYFFDDPVVKFMDGSNVISSKKLKNGEKISYPSTKKTGYSFIGWYIDSNLTIPYVPEKFINEDLTLYAAYINNDDVIYTSNYILDISNYSSEDSAYKFSATGSTTNAGYTSLGTSLGPRYNCMFFNAYESGVHSIYYSHCDNSSTYSITAKIENLSKGTVILSKSIYGKQYQSVSFKCDAGDLIKISIYIAENYSYSTFYLNIYTQGFGPKNNTSFKNDYLESVILFDDDLSLPIPKKTNYRFIGWYLDSELTEIFDSAKLTIPNDIILYARWEEV